MYQVRLGRQTSGRRTTSSDGDVSTPAAAASTAAGAPASIIWRSSGVSKLGVCPPSGPAPAAPCPPAPSSPMTLPPCHPRVNTLGQFRVCDNPENHHAATHVIRAWRPGSNMKLSMPAWLEGGRAAAPG